MTTGNGGMKTSNVESRPGAAFDSLEQEVFLNLWRTFDRLRMLEDEMFAGFDLTAQQYNVLRLLQGAGERGMATLKLAGRLVSRAPDITRMLDKLERRGLIERTRPPDNRRTVRVGLTPGGQKLMGEISAPLADCHSRQLGHLSVGQLRALVQLLQAARAPHEGANSPWRLELDAKRTL
jgi:DNA-binding MarR family transcriptional regulator